MGAAPSIITVPTTAIQKDVDCLRALCPSRFKLEKPSPSPEIDPIIDTTAILKDKNGPLTLILAAVPVTAAGRIAANRITFVLQENELRSVVNRCEALQIVAKTMHCGKDHMLAELNLPGGGAFALVSPAMVASDRARLELAKKLTESMTKSLPMGITRASSSRDLHAMSGRRSPSPRVNVNASRTPRRQQSFSGGRTSSPLPQNGRKSPSPGPLMSFSSPRAEFSSTSESSNNNTAFMLMPPSPSQHNKGQNKPQENAAIDGPTFPTLKFSALSLTGKYKNDFTPNARSPIHIETEFFVGQMVFLMRPQDPPTEDKYWNDRVFAQKSRRLVVQVQGKFKYEPKGPVYAGIEASQDLHMGRLSKGLSGLLLKWAEEKNQYLYYSFGDDKEKASAVVPAHTFFDRIVVTPQGRSPPSILEPIKEKQESIDYRMTFRTFDSKRTHQWTWNPSDTYSMSFCTSNIDLPTWSLPDVPGLGDVGIQNLIGNSMLRFVMYENFTPPEKDTRHLQLYIRYAFVVQVKYQGSNKANNTSDNSETPDMNIRAMNISTKKIGNNNIRQKGPPSKGKSETIEVFTNSNSGTTELDTMLDWVKKSPEDKQEKPRSSEVKAKEVSMLDAKQQSSEELKSCEEGDRYEEEGKTDEENGSGDVIDMQDEDSMDLQLCESDKFPREEEEEVEYDAAKFLEEKFSTTADDAPDLRPSLSAEAFDSLASIDALCPVWIEMCTPQGKYKRAYAFNVNGRTVFRTPKSFRDMVSVGKYLVNGFSESCVDRICSPRISSSERTRRLFGKMLENALTGRSVDSLVKMMEMYSAQFLKRRETSFPNKDKLTTTGGLVARALSDRQWVEEWVEITETSISFAHPETRKSHFLINTNCIIGVRRLEKEEGPVFYNHYFMAIETVGRTIYMMLGSETERKRCISAVSKFATRIIAKKQKVTKPPFHIPNPPSDLELNYPRGEFLQKSSMWNCKHRLIMNSKQMSFRTPVTMEQQNPLRFMERALQQVFDPEIEKSDDKLRQFLNTVSGLKDININDLREEHRLPFFLNMYHTMVAHASLILGPTDSQSALIKNFSCLSYQCSDDLISISELEHCIIRAAMAPVTACTPIFNPGPPAMVSPRLLKETGPVPATVNPVFLNFAIPTSKFCFALTKRDFRINFAINCGSPSNPAHVPIYKVETLDEQLDEAAYTYLHSNVTIKQRNKHHVCIVPTVISWYAEDFGTTNYSTLKTMEPYLNHSERKVIESADFSEYPTTIKYLPFNFECRILTLKTEPSSPRSKASDASVVTASSTSSATTSGASSTPSIASALEVPNGAEDDMDSLLDFLMDDNLKL